MKVKDVMTQRPEGIRSSQTLREAAEKMRDLNIGFLPVYDRDTVTGTITDRDIAIKGIASELNPDHASVGEIMSKQLWQCREEDDITTAARTMENAQVRRLLVTEGNGKVTGVLSLGDIATHSEPEFAGEVVHDISEPNSPQR
jgi:predicted transcriptional regulator